MGTWTWTKTIETLPANTGAAFSVVTPVLSTGIRLLFFFGGCTKRPCSLNDNGAVAANNMSSLTDDIKWKNFSFDKPPLSRLAALAAPIDQNRVVVFGGVRGNSQILGDASSSTLS